MSRLVVMNGGESLGDAGGPQREGNHQRQDRGDPRRDVRVSHMDTPGETDDALAGTVSRYLPPSRARDHEATCVPGVDRGWDRARSRAEVSGTIAMGW